MNTAGLHDADAPPRTEPSQMPIATQHGLAIEDTPVDMLERPAGEHERRYEDVGVEHDPHGVCRLNGVSELA
jgi:hypothetical protein